MSTALHPMPAVIGSCPTVADSSTAATATRHRVVAGFVLLALWLLGAVVHAETPENLRFVLRDKVATAVFVTSEARRVDGFTDALTVSIGGGRNAQYSLDGGAFTALAGSIRAGQSLAVRHISSSNGATRTDTVVSLGDARVPFASVTASDTSPNTFGFVSVGNAMPGATVESATVTPRGYDAPVAVRVSGGAYRIDGGAFVTSPGTLRPGQSLTLRHVADSRRLAYTQSAVTVGTTRATFTSRTQGAIAGGLPPDADGDGVADGADTCPGTAAGASVAPDGCATVRRVELTVTRAGTGVGGITSMPAGLDCGATCAANFPAGSIVTLAATPDADSRFAGYGGACAGTSCRLTLDADQAITARFEPLPPLVTLRETATQCIATDGTTTLTVDKSPWRYRLGRADATPVVQADPTVPDPATNPDRAACDDIQDGIDRCYPGLADVSYRPLAYRTDAWQYTTTTACPMAVEGRRGVRFVPATSDGKGATALFTFAADGAVELAFAPRAAGVTAVADAWNAPPTERYLGAGQRFGALDQRGRSVPLWISHGLGSDRYTSTNEIAAPFFWSTGGWGLWGAQDTRGEFNFANPAERADAVHLMVEAATLKTVFYLGTPQQVLATHTVRTGRPEWTPPDWMWRPMIWQDSDTSTASVQALVNGMKTRNIPLGAVWLDNPWDAGRSSFDFDKARFPEGGDALIDWVHAQGVKLMVWLSPYVGGAAKATADANGWTVTGVRADNNDATYIPARGLDPHLDFTDPAAFAFFQKGLEKLIARGVDGAKLDRCEEDLSDDSRWRNGRHNRDNHNPYCTRYHEAVFKAFAAQRPGGDFSILARGGWTGSARYTGFWAGDNLSAPGELGLTQALRSLLSLSASGMSWNGSDVGGYVGLRQDMGETAFGNPALPPTPYTYMRWTQLGALSPVMQSAIPPWWVSDEAIANYRRYATLHDRLAPYTAAAARESVAKGVPIVRPMAYAYPADAVASALEDQYLYGPDLLVAPITGENLESGVVTRAVYLPAGTWVNFWSGLEFTGPLTVPVVAAADELPLFVRKGAVLPPGVTAAELP